MANESAAPRPGLIERVRHYLFGDRPRAGKPRERGVLNQVAPAAEAGDTPILTSHGHGPSHAHDPRKEPLDEGW